MVGMPRGRSPLFGLGNQHPQHSIGSIPFLLEFPSQLDEEPVRLLTDLAIALASGLWPACNTACSGSLPFGAAGVFGVFTTNHYLAV